MEGLEEGLLRGKIELLCEILGQEVPKRGELNLDELKALHVKPRDDFKSNHGAGG